MRYGEELDETFRVLAEFLVARTTAMAAAVTLVRYSDLATLALGYHNLPEGYLEGMERVRQASEQGDYLRTRAAADQTYVLRNARLYMLERPEYAHMRDAIERAGYQTLIGVPFMARPETIGIVYLYYRQDVDVDDAELAFARAIGEYARPFMDNGWLFSETERRAKELEALHRADEAINRSLALDDVLAAMTDLAIDLLGADSSLVALFGDDDRLHVAVWRDLDPPTLAALETSYSRFARTQFDPVSSRRETGVTENVHTDPRTHDGLRGLSVGSAAEIPVVVDGRLWGLFSIGWSRPRQFSETEKRTFNAFAARAAMAIQNALVFEESQRRAREMEALYRADEALHRSLELEDVLAAMTDLAVDLLGADSSLVASFSDDGRLEVAASRGLRPALLQVISDGYRRFDRAHFARLQQPVRTGLIEDVQKEMRIEEHLRSRMAGSLAEIPVFAGSELWGIFSIGWARVRKFTPADRQMFEAFSARASLAIQNALLFEQAQVAASLEERQRIARELHDSVSQALYGIGLGARTLRRRLGQSPDQQIADPLDYITTLAEGGLAETRALIFELIPNSIETDGLATALQRQAAASQARSGVPIAVRLCDEPDITVRAKEALYRIAQESLGNVVKHAGATAASVSLEDTDGLVVLRISDNGRGFDPAGDFPGHFGLRSMAERARKVGGAYNVESAPGAGATITVRLPKRP